ncbi:unnamed protein product [Adineta steineri]|uniref:Helix-turn-helix domain-containing protein n=1 Tax=Adineta steineri TaxID=433720 RepID=A0A820BGD1_9BILA|nr:unnamed protein product [Adineta steineri]
MLNIIKQRLQNIDERFRCLHQLKLHFFRANSEDQELDLIHHRSIDILSYKSTKNSCAPTLIQDAIHYLSKKELAFLHRGPTYVSPCHLHDPSSPIIFDLALNKHIAPLQQQLTKLFTKHSVDFTCRLVFEKAIRNQFIRSFSDPIPTSVKVRASNEKKLIRSIQFQLKQNNLILRRTADDQNMYYLGERDEFDRIANEFIDNTLCYECITVIDNQNSNFEQEYLHELIHSINSDLKKLQQNRIIREDHLSKIQIDKKATIRIPHLYFLPEIHQDGHISVQPRFTCSSSSQYPIQRLATYLDQIIRPLFESYSRSTSFRNGTDFIQQLQHYCGQSNRLLPVTNFITFEIQHFHYRVSHEALVLALNKFLHRDDVRQIRHDGLTADAVEKLVEFFLDHHIFIYNGKIYRHLKGGPLNVPLTELLGNIYLHQWHLPLITEIRLADQFYGHYHHMGFLIWHGSRDKLNKCFNELNQQHPDIPVTISIGLHVSFLNVDIENRQGNLHTCVYHDPNQQPFLLPYAINYPRISHRQWVRFALLRAGQYCSSWDDFQDERIYIELTCLANGYSLDFVEYHMEQFFTRLHPMNRGIILNRWTYPTFRTRLFTYMREQQQRQLKNNPSFIQLSYLFDWGSRCEFNEKFDRLWWQILESNTRFRNLNLRVKLTAKHCYPSNAFFFP